MKKYNIQNYVRYKTDTTQSIESIDDKQYHEYTRDELIIILLPLVETIARKFSTGEQASGILDITDLIQEGVVGLIYAVDKIEWELISSSTDPEKTLKSFVSKRIKGAIRRAIDINRGNIRIPEHKLNEMRKNTGEDKRIVQMFFNSIFLSLDNTTNEDGSSYDVIDSSKTYNIDLMNKYLLGIMETYLDIKEYDVLRMSYGLDCDKMSAKDIADKLNIKGTASYVRISQIKREAIDKLIESVDPSQVIDWQ